MLAARSVVCVPAVRRHWGWGAVSSDRGHCVPRPDEREHSPLGVHARHLLQEYKLEVNGKWGWTGE